MRVFKSLYCCVVLGLLGSAVAAPLGTSGDVALANAERREVVDSGALMVRAPEPVALADSHILERRLRLPKMSGKKGGSHHNKKPKHKKQKTKSKKDKKKKKKHHTKERPDYSQWADPSLVDPTMFQRPSGGDSRQDVSQQTQDD
ncbi:hypothetical protein HDU97_002725 [Phlyctochytrium planicorne]|nr:hypothetical protein HDU97_002725 [Phlyctochytrium planicorne]